MYLALRMGDYGLSKNTYTREKIFILVSSVLCWNKTPLKEKKEEEEEAEGEGGEEGEEEVEEEEPEEEEEEVEEEVKSL